MAEHQRHRHRQVLQSGSVTADSAGLVTIPGVQILTDNGNRLILNAFHAVPVVLAPVGATTTSDSDDYMDQQ